MEILSWESTLKEKLKRSLILRIFVILQWLIMKFQELLLPQISSMDKKI